MYLEKLVIDNIRRIRKEKGFSQEKLAEACNTATSYIGLMEIYRNVPKLSTIEKIARALNIDPLILFQDPQKKSPEWEYEINSKKERILLTLDKEIDYILHNWWFCIDPFVVEHIPSQKGCRGVIIRVR